MMNLMMLKEALSDRERYRVITIFRQSKFSAWKNRKSIKTYENCEEKQLSSDAGTYSYYFAF